MTIPVLLSHLRLMATLAPTGTRPDTSARILDAAFDCVNDVGLARTTVEVNAWWNAETVEIIISDDGPGIAPDMLNRIGEPYLSRRRSTDEDQKAAAPLR